MDRQKAMSRIRKCLALSASPEPHEAAAALRQAQKLMAEFEVTEAELGIAAVHSALVKTREGFGPCVTMSHLCSMLQAAFGVRSVWEPNPGSAARLNVRYFGPEARVLLAEYSHRVVWRAMEGAWDKFLSGRRHLAGTKGARQSFHLGWLHRVAEAVSELSPSDEERAAMDAWVRSTYGSALGTGKQPRGTRVDGALARAGMSAAEGFTLSVPVGAEPAKITN